jgi:hypothetical protein
MGKKLTNIGCLMMVAGVLLILSYSVPATALLVVGFFVAVVGRMAT